MQKRNREREQSFALKQRVRVMSFKQISSCTAFPATAFAWLAPKDTASLPWGCNRKQGHRERHEGSDRKKAARRKLWGNEERETKPMKAGRKSSSRGSGDGGGNELFSLLPAASGATDQTRPHGFISYAEEANTTSHSNVKLHRSEGVVFFRCLLFLGLL